MKKLIAILLAVMLVVSMAIPAHAVTPNLEIPDMPEIPDIGDDIVIDIPEDVFDDWFEEHPVPPLVPIEPTEPVEDEPPVPDYSDWITWFRGWFWWMPGFCN